MASPSSTSSRCSSRSPAPRALLTPASSVPITWDSEDIAYYVGFQVDLVDQPNAILDRMKDGTYVVNYSLLNAPPKSLEMATVELAEVEEVWAEEKPVVGRTGNLQLEVDGDEREVMETLGMLERGGLKSLETDADRKQLNKLLLDNVRLSFVADPDRAGEPLMSLVDAERRLYSRSQLEGIDAVLLAEHRSGPRVRAEVRPPFALLPDFADPQLQRARRQDPLRPLPPLGCRPRHARAQGFGQHLSPDRHAPLPHPPQALGLHLDRGLGQASQCVPSPFAPLHR